MKAILCSRYGAPLEVLQLKEVEKPVPAEGRVLVRVRAASVNKMDLAPVRGALVARLLGTGLTRPKDPRIGGDLAGVVEAVGPGVDRFHPGDEVFGTAPGSFAEFASARQDRLVPKPAGVSFEAAAAVPVAGLSALQGLRKGALRPDARVLVCGASGGVGTFAIQIARAAGAVVTAECSPANLDQAHALGAERVIDYTREDFSLDAERFDLILAVNGHHSLRAYRRALTPTGRCVVLGGSFRQILQSLTLGPLFSRRGGRQLLFLGIAQLNLADLDELGKLLAAGQLAPVIDRRYPLSRAAEAVGYLDEGHAHGKVVIDIE